MVQYELFSQLSELAFNVLDAPVPTSGDVLGERMEPMTRRTHHREDDDEVAGGRNNAVLTSASLPFVDVGRSNKPTRHIPHQVRISFIWAHPCK